MSLADEQTRTEIELMPLLAALDRMMAEYSTPEECYASAQALLYGVKSPIPEGFK